MEYLGIRMAGMDMDRRTGVTVTVVTRASVCAHVTIGTREHYLWCGREVVLVPVGVTNRRIPSPRCLFWRMGKFYTRVHKSFAFSLKISRQCDNNS